MSAKLLSSSSLLLLVKTHPPCSTVSLL